MLAGALGERADGKWAAFEVGLDAPRQNGKGSILESRELAGLFLFGEELLIHSAHEQATSSEHFRRLLQLIEEAEFQRRLKKVVRGKGAEAIELQGGQRIFFKTRTGGGGRGLTGDLVVLDEAMILPEATSAALVPTMAARSIDGNPQLWYAGSAVDQEKHEHGVVFSRVRARGMADAPRVAWFEWSAEGEDPAEVPDEVREDPAVWAQANPGMGIRISAEHIENECNGALGKREFVVERLGIGDWPDPAGEQHVIDMDLWGGLEDLNSQAPDPVCFAFDVAPDRAHAAIAVAGRRSDGLIHIEVVECAAGTDWVLPKVQKLAAAHECLTPLCDGPAASLLPDFERAGIKVDTTTAGDMAKACGQFYDAAVGRNLRHLGTSELTSALKGAVERPLGDAWAWHRRKSTVDITPLVACTLAVWGVAKQQVSAPMIGVVGR